MVQESLLSLSVSYNRLTHDITLATRLEDKVMATQYGQLHEFQPETESIGAYLERIDIFFQANDIQEQKRVPVS